MLYIYPIGNEISIYVQNTTTIINAKQEIITCSYKYIFYQSMKQKKKACKIMIQPSHEKVIVLILIFCSNMAKAM